MKKHRSWQTGVSLVWLFLMSSAGFDLAWAQEPVGVVTALQGTAQLTRPATPTPVVLRFKDGLLLRDIIDTQEKSLARVLFGGKSTVTVKELSRLEVREEVLPTGATRAVHELSSGAILVNVARELMRPGDEVQIRTPNTVAAVRGTTVIAQFIPALSQSILTVLSGTASVTPQGLPPLTLAPNTA
ncbi:MAG: FecR domain-containing protein, partial [Nitrospinae bacterium]|nr:FecR domain-containing protein [Nitrospinota bacterium]